MKRKELEAIITDLGLEFEVENNIGHTIMQVWQPYTNSGFKIDGKYYSAGCLGKPEVTNLNSNFQKLLDVLRKNKIQIIHKNNIENGVISTWILALRSETLINAERNLDFEIETDITSDIVSYDYVMPTEIGYMYSTFRTRTLYSADKLRKHELELVLKNINELVTAIGDKTELIVDFSVHNGSVEPLKHVIEKGLMTPKDVVETLFKSEDVYYDRQGEYGKIFKLLVTYKIDDLDLLKNSRRGNLPDLVVDSVGMFKEILKNWEFTRSTAEKILTFLVQDEHFKQFKQFIDTKDPKRYQFTDWYDVAEQTIKLLCADDAKFLKKLFTTGWLDLRKFTASQVEDLIIEDFNSMDNDAYILLITQYMSDYPANHKQLLELLFDKFDKEDFHDSNLTKEVMDAFIKNMKINSVGVFMINDAAILLYLPESHPLRKTLLETPAFIKYLIEIDKIEYLPKDAKDIFLF